MDSVVWLQANNAQSKLNHNWAPAKIKCYRKNLLGDNLFFFLFHICFFFLLVKGTRYLSAHTIIWSFFLVDNLIRRRRRWQFVQLKYSSTSIAKKQQHNQSHEVHTRILRYRQPTDDIGPHTHTHTHSIEIWLSNQVQTEKKKHFFFHANIGPKTHATKPKKKCRLWPKRGSLKNAWLNI